jgi:hypothetical protein
MAKADIIKKLAEEFGFEAREELLGKELEAILTGFEAKAAVAEYKELVADMQEQLEVAGAKAAKAPEVVTTKVDGKAYEVTGGAIVPGYGKLSAKELADNQEAVLAVLEKEGQTILKLL